MCICFGELWGNAYRKSFIIKGVQLFRSAFKSRRLDQKPVKIKRFSRIFYCLLSANFFKYPFLCLVRRDFFVLILLKIAKPSIEENGNLTPYRIGHTSTAILIIIEHEMLLAQHVKHALITAIQLYKVLFQLWRNICLFFR